MTNRTAFVTGASRGIGLACAKALAASGARVVLAARDAAKLEAAAAELPGASWLELDLASPESIKAAFAKIGRVDILVNNAGILSGRKPWHTLTKEEMNRYVQTNFMGYFLVTKAMYPLIKKSKTPRVINVASRTYFLANPGQMAYVASKGAVLGFNRVLARELGEDGIPVNAVMPGMVATPGTTEHSQEEAFNRVMNNQAIKKRVLPEHLAALIAFLASDDAEMITGQTILCDGGGYLI